jgi:hypothetical protein
MRRTIWQGCQISPLFHEDAQDDQAINLIILRGRGLGFFWLFYRAGGHFHLLPAQSGEQTGRSLCLRATYWRPSRLSSVSSGLGWPRAGIRGVVFSKLSKLLNQEDALSAPWLQHLRNYVAR